MTLFLARYISQCPTRKQCHVTVIVVISLNAQNTAFTSMVNSCQIGESIGKVSSPYSPPDVVTLWVVLGLIIGSWGLTPWFGQTDLDCSVSQSDFHNILWSLKSTNIAIHFIEWHRSCASSGEWGIVTIVEYPWSLLKSFETSCTSDGIACLCVHCVSLPGTHCRVYSTIWETSTIFLVWSVNVR